jgi:hypothetical protein
LSAYAQQYCESGRPQIEANARCIFVVYRNFCSAHIGTQNCLQRTVQLRSYLLLCLCLQVHFAQSVLGFSGQGVRIGILDDGVDWKHSSNWGRCTALATPNGTCRVVAAYNPFSETGDTVRVVHKHACCGNLPARSSSMGAQTWPIRQLNLLDVQ